MKAATIFQLLIASPSDVAAERVAVREVIHKWNQNNSSATGVVFEPLLWETSVMPDVGAGPQEVVDEQIADRSDAVIGLFWSRAGTPTKRASGGAAQEVLDAIERGKPVLVYQSRMSLPSDVDIPQLEACRRFIADVGARGILGTYGTYEELIASVEAALSKLATRLCEQHGVHAESAYTRKVRNGRSFYVFKANKERLRGSADRLYDFDIRSIQRAVEHVVQNRPPSDRPLRVLDVGCGDGYVTRTRFKMVDNCQITGIDWSADAIGDASAESDDPRCRWLKADVMALDEEAGRFDIIWASEALHHLENPEGMLHRLWALLDTPGALIVRSSDDGLKLNFPTDEELDFLLHSTNTIRGSSDRLFGRKVPTFVARLYPEPERVEADYFVDSTVGMSEGERLTFFDSYYTYRQNYAIWLTEKPEATEADFELAERLVRITREQRERFQSDSSLFSVSVQNTTVGYKG